MAAEAGPVAHRVLRDGARGHVHSVFERSFYCALGDDLICIGPRGLGSGPLNVICEPWPAGLGLGAAARPGDAAVVTGSTLRAGRIEIHLGAARRWQPSPPPPWTRASLTSGVTACLVQVRGMLTQPLVPAETGTQSWGREEGLDARFRGHERRDGSHVDPSEGVASLLLGDAAVARSRVAAAALAPARALEAAIRGAHPRIDIAALAPLIGLGPGLTPSGDDLLGGTMVALARLGLTDLRDGLWRAAAPLARTATNDISHAHLSATAEGIGSGVLHALIDTVMANERTAMPARIELLARIGHTSGWDALTGALLALRAASIDLHSSNGES